VPSIVNDALRLHVPGRGVTVVGVGAGAVVVVGFAIEVVVGATVVVGARVVVVGLTLCVRPAVVVEAWTCNEPLFDVDATAPTESAMTSATTKADPTAAAR
jgi:hypothetical protein